MKFRVNSAMLRYEVSNTGLPRTDCARICKIGHNTFQRFFRSDPVITAKTADKLKRHFGDNVIIIEEAEQ